MASARLSRRRARLSRRRTSSPIYVAGVLLAVLAVYGAQYLLNDTAGQADVEAVPTSLTLPPGTSLSDLQQARVVNVIDGDTIDVTLDGHTQRVRYYGIDTPERGDRCYSEATSRNRTLTGTTVLLLPDARDEDRNGRLLRYIFTLDGRSVDATLVAEGYAIAWRQGGQYRDQIISLENAAQAAGRGCLWE